MKPILAGLVAMCLCCAGGGSARAGCATFADLKAAQENADKAAAALSGVALPADIERRIARLTADEMFENPAMPPEQALKNAIARLSAAEQLAAAPWYAAKQARDAADAAAAQALEAFTLALNRKDEALRQARAEYDIEVKHLDAEKAALQGMPRDDAYLDRILQLTDRLKKAYNKMLADLQPHRDCFGDADVFAKDKEERLLRIDALEEKIATIRGAAPPAKPADAKPADPAQAGVQVGGKTIEQEPASPDPIGDTVYVFEAPEVSGLRGKLTKSSADGFEFEVKRDDGTIARAGVRIVKGPPATIRANEKVELVAEAYGDLPAFSQGSWFVDNVVGGQLPCDNGCGSIDGKDYKGQGNPKVATVRFYFGAGGNPHIRFTGGQYNSPDNTEMHIVWRVKPQ